MKKTLPRKRRRRCIQPLSGLRQRWIESHPASAQAKQAMPAIRDWRGRAPGKARAFFIKQSRFVQEYKIVLIAAG